MIVFSPFLLLLIDNFLSVFIGLSSIFILMRAYSAYLHKAGKNINTIYYIFFAPELLTGPFRSYSQWKPLRIDTGKLSISLGVILNRIIIILVSGIIYTKLTGHIDQNFLAVLIAYITLYAQFASISDIVNQLSALFGQAKIKNFSKPLLANSITDFWDRWHISLGYFVKTHLSQPMSFYLTKKGLDKKLSFFSSVIFSFIFVGLWHNYSLEYFLFGFYFGCIVFIERTYLSSFFKKIQNIKYGLYFCIAYTQILHIIAFSFVFEYVDSILVKI